MSIDNLKNRYEAKKQSCVARMIPFELSYEEWCVLHELKNTQTCAYLNRKFSNKKGCAFNASIERINDDLGYVVGNILWVSNFANSLRNDHLALGKGIKGLKPETIGYIHRIKKIHSSQENIDEVLKPYTEAFATLNNSTLLKQRKIAQENAMKLQEEKKLKKYEEELAFSQHYYTIANEFKSIDVPLQITIGEMKKKMKCLSDQVTGKPFASVNEKRIFVVNKALPVTRHNVKIVHASTQNALDVLTLGSNGAKLASNLKKMF